MKKNNLTRFLLAALIVIFVLIIARFGARKMPTIAPQAEEFSSWISKKAPDFALQDLTGKEHGLNDYIGKDVLVVFWATWCPPCRSEIPHLIELRDEISPDKLEILAISDEGAAILQPFVAANKINYTILSSYQKTLPSPYNMVSSIPMAFFVNPQGRFTKISLGAMSLNEIKGSLTLK